MGGGGHSHSHGGSDDEDEDDEDSGKDEGESWFAGGERRFVVNGLFIDSLSYEFWIVDCLSRTQIDELNNPVVISFAISCKGQQSMSHGTLD